MEIIPDLYELKEIPRCKTKIHPNFKKTKKIALYDLDETIVHCIGEINMNNVENFSRQCDEKLKDITWRKRSNYRYKYKTTLERSLRSYKR